MSIRKIRTPWNLPGLTNDQRLTFYNELRRRYTFVAWLPDGSIVGSFTPPDTETREIHTGVDWYGPRMRFIYESLTKEEGRDSICELSNINDEPTGWVKKVPMPRYFAIAYPAVKTPLSPKPLVLTICGDPLENKNMVEAMKEEGNTLEYFQDDLEGNGIRRFLIRAKELGTKNADVIGKLVNKTHSWNLIFLAGQEYGERI